MRIDHSDRRLSPVERGAPVDVTLDGRIVRAYRGETVAAVLLAQGIRVFRHDSSGRPHGLYCGIGNCYECLVTVDGLSNTRACVTEIAAGMIIETGARP